MILLCDTLCVQPVTIMLQNDVFIITNASQIEEPRMSLFIIYFLTAREPYALIYDFFIVFFYCFFSWGRPCNTSHGFLAKNII